MSKRLDLASLKGDLAGGATSAVLTVPVSMGYGVLALLPLGDQYISVGILAGLYSAIFLRLTILLLGDRNTLMYAPRSVVTFLLASVIAGGLAQPPGRQTLVLIFLIIFLAGIFQALFGILRLGTLIRYIPSPVIWSLQAIRRLLARDFVYWKAMALDLLVVVLVATVTIVYNLVAGVAVGVAVAVLFFLLRMSKSVIRRTYRADVVRSRRTRDPRLMELLAVEGRKIVAFELEGPIFFGTAEYLAAQVETALQEETSYVVLDLKRVNELDNTGARVMQQLQAKLARQGRRLLVSHAQDSALLWSVLKDMGVAAALARDARFADTDAALEWAEDQLIQGSRSGAGLSDEVPLDRLTVLAGLTAAERELVGRALGRRVYQRGDIVIQEGDTDRSLFLISKGTASVKVRLAGQDREKRLASFSAGAVFGEVALLDEEPRSATVTADEEIVCYVLDDARFRALTREHPAIAVTLLANLSRELSRRLRKANAMIALLEG